MGENQEVKMRNTHNYLIIFYNYYWQCYCFLFMVTSRYVNRKLWFKKIPSKKIFFYKKAWQYGSVSLYVPIA